ncbi:MAG TPA: hypothetical protein VE397_11115 [Stellaceae bacterium]|nr:hypothetical protein [Stellaceae bacterium]
MRSSFVPCIPADALGREPRSYDDLVRLAARYARDRLTGLTVVNGETQRAVTLGPAALAAATRPGTPAAVLKAVAALPTLLSQARYVRTIAGPGDRADIRRLHLFAATAEIEGRRITLRLTVQENVDGRCFLGRITEGGVAFPRRQQGGAAPEDADSSVNASNPPPQLDIFVGGAGDASDGPVMRYLYETYNRVYAPQFHRQTQYFSWEDMDGFLNAIRSAPPGTAVNVIAHRYGAHTAALDLGMMAPTGIHVNKFISIDPVGRSSIPDNLRGAVDTWVNVSSAPTHYNWSDFIADLGGKGGHLSADQADFNYSVPTNHANFATMMNTVGPEGLSPEQILLGNAAPGP